MEQWVHPIPTPPVLHHSTTPLPILMRPDMHKVVVERPRSKSWCVPQFPRPKRPFDDLPKHQSMTAVHKHHKSFTDVLGPLKRWLRRQIGRPWNDAYSEACAVIKPDSVVRAHIKTHLLEMVVRHTFLKDGELWCRDGQWSQAEVPISQVTGRWRIAYVDPETGILRAMPKFKRKKPMASAPIDSIRLSEETELRRINGLWFRIQTRKLSPGEPGYDLLTRRVRTERTWPGRNYRPPIICVAKRQLSTKELRRHGLANDASGDGGLSSSRESEARKTAIVRAGRPVSLQHPTNHCHAYSILPPLRRRRVVRNHQQAPQGIPVGNPRRQRRPCRPRRQAADREVGPKRSVPLRFQPQLSSSAVCAPGGMTAAVDTTFFRE